MGDKAHMLAAYLRHRLTAKHGGHGIHSPFAYALCENVFYRGELFYDFRKLAAIRERLLADRREVDTGGHGAGSRRFASPRRTVSEIARHGITPQPQSETLYSLCNFLGIQSVIELGTSLGMNTLYLAMQNTSGKVISIEGSGDLAAFARSLAAENDINNVEFINDKFETALPQVLQEVTEPLLVYVDGDHSYEATMTYFRLLLPLARDNNVFVFDDIYWSRGMTKAWREICAHEVTRLSIDTFFAGYIFFRPEIRDRVTYRLAL